LFTKKKKLRYYNESLLIKGVLYMKKVQKYDFEGSFSEREREGERVALCG